MPRRLEPATPSHLVGPLLAFLAERGVSPAPLIERFALSADAPASQSVPIGPVELGRLFDAAAELLDEPHLGLVLPAALRFPSYELPELAARASPTLRESLLRMVRYAPLVNGSVLFELDERGATARFGHRIGGHPRGIGRHVHEFAMAAALHHARQRVGADFAATEVHFIHSRPASLERLEEHFARAALRFGQLQNTLLFDARWLDATQATADSRLLVTADTLAEDAMRQRAAQGSELAERVRRHLREQLERGDMRVRALARELRMSVRSLQRRLEEENTSFAAQLDGVRSDVSRALVASDELSLGEIATRLGFSEFATFSRAFKRWHGVAPGVFRAAQRSAP
jgi:AraC-like DNA-binding protein